MRDHLTPKSIGEKYCSAISKQFQALLQARLGNRSGIDIFSNRSQFITTVFVLARAL